MSQHDGAAGWVYSPLHQAAGRIIGEQTLWGRRMVDLWLADSRRVVRVPADSLQPLPERAAPQRTAAQVIATATAAWIADVIAQHSQVARPALLLAPLEARVIPLPHQLSALQRAISAEQVRFLLADEVGLGKTIEAGLILRELKLRGLVRRTLIVAPKSIAAQWRAEMLTHFNENFHLVLAEDIDALHRLAGAGEAGSSGWQMHEQVIVTLDGVKPTDRRRGWSEQQLAEYNHRRFDALVSADWDLVIIDEAHRIGGSTEQTARYRLGRALAEAVPALLLLSATPHQGDSNAFFRLLNLLDERAFATPTAVVRERVQRYVIRTEKRKALDSRGQPLFQPRWTQLVSVAWTARQRLQQLLYEEVSEYVRVNYNRAMLSQQRAVGFLMLLMQRLVASSTAAIRSALERRLAVLRGGVSRLPNEPVGSDDDIREDADIYDNDGQQLIDRFLQAHSAALRDETSAVERLLELAVSAEQAAADAKAEALLEWIYRLQAEEGDSELKLLIFTEFVATQQMLLDFLRARGFSAVALNGALDIEQRQAIQQQFRASERILVSTDAGGEGINLQFAHVVINFDMPWNPMRLEQRIGRVDRIGQTRRVRALNFMLADSVDQRVRDVLEQKLATILSEFGVDKTGDVLDSAQAGALYHDVYAQAIANPQQLTASVEQTVTRVTIELQRVRETVPLYSISDGVDAQLAERTEQHPLPYWLERMTLAAVEADGGTVERRRDGWHLRWADGTVQRGCVFQRHDTALLNGATLMTLEDGRIRRLVETIARHHPGSALPQVSIAGLPQSINGWWGLFELRVRSAVDPGKVLRQATTRRGFSSIFVSDEGRAYLPTARHIWEALVTGEIEVSGSISGAAALQAAAELQRAAEATSETLYQQLVDQQRAAIGHERERAAVAAAAQQRAIERIGLDGVRRHRAARLAEAEARRQQALADAEQIVAELQPLLMIRIGTGGAA